MVIGMRTIRSRVHRSTSGCLPGSNRQFKVQFGAAGLAEVEEEIYNFLMSCRRQLPDGSYDFEPPDGSGPIVISVAPKTETSAAADEPTKDMQSATDAGKTDKVQEHQEEDEQTENTETQSITADSPDSRCQAVNKNGERCKRNALPGSPFCAMHQP
jgi:hypothetical protein